MLPSVPLRLLGILVLLCGICQWAVDGASDDNFQHQVWVTLSSKYVPACHAAMRDALLNVQGTRGEDDVVILEDRNSPRSRLRALISPQKLDSVLARVPRTCFAQTQNRVVSDMGITKRHATIEYDHLAKEQKRMRELLGRCTTVEAVLAVEQELSALQRDLARAESTITRVNGQTGLASVTIEFETAPEDDPDMPKDDGWTSYPPFPTIIEGVIAGGRTLERTLTFGLAGLGVIIPFALILAVFARIPCLRKAARNSSLTTKYTTAKDLISAHHSTAKGTLLALGIALVLAVGINLEARTSYEAYTSNLRPRSRSFKRSAPERMEIASVSSAHMAPMKKKAHDGAHNLILEDHGADYDEPPMAVPEAPQKGPRQLAKSAIVGMASNPKDGESCVTLIRAALLPDDSLSRGAYMSHLRVDSLVGARVEAQVPSDDLDAALRRLPNSSTCSQENMAVMASDVTNQHDTAFHHRANLEATRDRLLQLSSKAKDIETQLLPVERELRKVVGQLAQESAGLERIKSRVALSSVAVHVQYTPPPKQPKWMKLLEDSVRSLPSPIRGAVRGLAIGMMTLGSMLEHILFFMAATIPFLPLLAIAFCCCRGRRPSSEPLLGDQAQKSAS